MDVCIQSANTVFARLLEHGSWLLNEEPEAFLQWHSVPRELVVGGKPSWWAGPEGSPSKIEIMGLLQPFVMKSGQYYAIRMG